MSRPMMKGGLVVAAALAAMVAASDTSPKERVQEEDRRATLPRPHPNQPAEPFTNRKERRRFAASQRRSQRGAA